jgi:hypothetical protein
VTTTETSVEYASYIAKLATKHVLRTTLAFLDDPSCNFVPADMIADHEPRVRFVVYGDHTLTPQTLHSFDCKGKDINCVQPFEALTAYDLATLAIFIAATRAQVLVLCSKFPTLATAKAAAEVA